MTGKVFVFDDSTYFHCVLCSCFTPPRFPSLLPLVSPSFPLSLLPSFFLFLPPPSFFLFLSPSSRLSLFSFFLPPVFLYFPPSLPHPLHPSFPPSLLLSLSTLVSPSFLPSLSIPLPFSFKTLCSIHPCCPLLPPLFSSFSLVKFSSSTLTSLPLSPYSSLPFSPSLRPRFLLSLPLYTSSSAPPTPSPVISLLCLLPPSLP